MVYDWHRTDLPYCEDRAEIALLASHQDQVFALPPGATLVASSAFCPVAAFTVADEVFCIQPHPEFDEAFSRHLLDKRSHILGPDIHSAGHDSLHQGHEGAHIARMVVAFLENPASAN
jgi:GMP synthase-like glutamine amidotransferase